MKATIEVTILILLKIIVIILMQSLVLPSVFDVMNLGIDLMSVPRESQSMFLKGRRGRKRNVIIRCFVDLTMRTKGMILNMRCTHVLQGNLFSHKIMEMIHNATRFFEPHVL